jgi:hypothetical protein
MKSAIVKQAIMKSATLTALVSSLTLLGMSAVAYADVAPAAPALPTFPALSGPLTANAKPFSFEAGPVGNVFVTGVVSGIVQAQSNPVAGIASSQTDISNAQVFINKTDGPIQFAGQFGSYSLPALGVPYLKAEKIPQATYGVFSQGYIKLVPSDTFNVMVGKLPTMIGAEYTYSFENMNVQRGLLWNQENAVSRGIQANYTQGSVALSAALTDGFYSNKYNWAWLSATYTMDTSNTFALIGGGNVSRDTKVSTFATPVLQNNSQIYNLIYTHTAGAWTIQPYLQYTNVPELKFNGTKSGSTTGAALLASYKVNDNISLPFRLEYLGSSGNKTNPAAPNLLGYGAGSKAWSLTVTPTYQYKIFFVRGELSYVGLNNGTVGSQFGKNGDKTTQVTGLIETGIMF